MDASTHFLETAIQEFKRYKGLADKALAQVSDEELHFQPDEESNSLAIILKHVSGNLRSRWTDFLTTDGEKPDRNRDEEFVDHRETRDELLADWESGWNILFKTLENLSGDQLMQFVHIRKQPLTVTQAICRQLTHYGYHVGQMVYIAKMIRQGNWQTLSIPRNASLSWDKKY